MQFDATVLQVKQNYNIENHKYTYYFLHLSIWRIIRYPLLSLKSYKKQNSLTNIIRWGHYSFENTCTTRAWIWMKTINTLCTATYCTCDLSNDTYMYMYIKHTYMYMYITHTHIYTVHTFVEYMYMYMYEYMKKHRKEVMVLTKI